MRTTPSPAQQNKSEALLGEIADARLCFHRFACSPVRLSRHLVRRLSPPPPHERDNASLTCPPPPHDTAAPSSLHDMHTTQCNVAIHTTNEAAHHEATRHTFSHIFPCTRDLCHSFFLTVPCVITAWCVQVLFTTKVLGRRTHYHEVCCLTCCLN